MSAPLVVSVGMTHPQNIAGLGLDVRIAAEYGVRHAMVVAAVSAQDDRGVHQVVPLEPTFVQQQLQAARLRDAAAVRVGALGRACTFAAVAAALHGQRVIIDPVMRSSAGGSLYVDDPLQALRWFSGGAHTIVTPNIEEAHQLTGLHIAGRDDMITAGEQLVRDGTGVALVKGGHLPGEPIDILVSEDGVETFAAPRLPGKTRGTGCMLAMALACELALGRDLVDAVKGARAFVRTNIARP